MADSIQPYQGNIATQGFSEQSITSQETIATVLAARAKAEVEAAVIGDADIAELSIDLAKTQTLYQMTLMSVADMLSLSLIDFLTG